MGSCCWKRSAAGWDQTNKVLGSDKALSSGWVLRGCTGSICAEDPGASPAAGRCPRRSEEAAAGAAHCHLPGGGCEGQRGTGGTDPAGAGGRGEWAWDGIVLLLSCWISGYAQQSPLVPSIITFPL